MARDPRGPLLDRPGQSAANDATAEAARERNRRADPLSVSMLMRNDVQFSSCDLPSVAVAPGRMELVRVVLQGDLLTIADVRGEGRLPSGVAIEQVGARLYARKTIALDGATAFMLLLGLPDWLTDEQFFPAEGTVILIDGQRGGRRSLRACGMDRNSGVCQGWIFDAVEV